MKIVLTCDSCEHLSTGRFRSKLKVVGQDDHTVEVVTQSPLLPGSYYYVMLKGIFPNDNIDSFSVNNGSGSSKLEGLAADRWCDWLRERRKNGDVIW